MREIKFRAYWKEAREMVEVEALRRNGSIEFFVGVRSGVKAWREHQVLDEPEQYDLMQSTGLKDKNGVEIYEGDIVFVYAKGTEDEVAFRFTADMEGGDVYSRVGLENCEVIGNIHQHGYLLGK